MADCLGFADEGDVTALVLEDLSAATWPPPWSDALVDVVRRTLDELQGVDPPPGLGSPTAVGDLTSGWAGVAADPQPFLALGLCAPEWLDRHLDALIDAAARAPLDGDRLVHLDVRSDNLCVREGRCLLVDWNQAARGNPLLDLVLWLPSLRLEGGPPPQALAGPEAADLAAAFAGYLAVRAGRPEPPTAPPHGVRPLQRAQLEIALPWAAEALGLEPPA
jgi:aminoglycoside phosphotransferase (APT) family kinase protein